MKGLRSWETIMFTRAKLCIILALHAETVGRALAFRYQNTMVWESLGSPQLRLLAPASYVLNLLLTPISSLHTWPGRQEHTWLGRDLSVEVGMHSSGPTFLPQPSWKLPAVSFTMLFSLMINLWEGLRHRLYHSMPWTLTSARNNQGS